MQSQGSYWKKAISPPRFPSCHLGNFLSLRKHYLFTILFTALYFSDACSSFAGSTFKEMPYDPYRKVGATYYNLQPIYVWLRNSQKPDTQPLSEWYGVIHSDGYVIERFVVDQVLEDGILIHFKSIGPTGNEFTGTPFFLTNFPSIKQVTEGEEIKFLALRAGNYKFTDTSGASRTVPLYDYGVAYNPWKKLKESKINSDATNATK